MAKWIHNIEDSRFTEHWTCSYCGHDIIENPHFINAVTGEYLDFDFCPYCGIKMDVVNNRPLIEENK